MTEPVKDCSTCRYASTDKRPKIMSETGFDDQLMFEDTDETVYTCRAFGPPEGIFVDKLCEHAGKEIGTTPITCAAYAPPARRDLSALDEMIARREARTARKSDD